MFTAFILAADSDRVGSARTQELDRRQERGNASLACAGRELFSGGSEQENCIGGFRNRYF